MKRNGQDEQKFVHSLAVLRFIVKKMPKDVAESEISTLMALLSHLNLSNYQDEDLTSALTVNGSASASQIADLTHYDESSVRAKLKRWQSLGYVDWTKREDNRGSDFTVYCAPQPDVIAKSKVDPKRSEQAREAQRIRWEKERSANVDTSEGEAREGNASATRDAQGGCASLDAGYAKSDSTGALNEIRTGVSRLATLELLSGTVSATSSGTGNRAAEQAKTDKTDRSKTTPKATPAPLKDSVPETQPGPSRIPDPAVGSSASRSPVPSTPVPYKYRWPLPEMFDLCPHDYNGNRKDQCRWCGFPRPEEEETDDLDQEILAAINAADEKRHRRPPTRSVSRDQFKQMTGAVDVDHAPTLDSPTQGGNLI